MKGRGPLRVPKMATLVTAVFILSLTFFCAQVHGIKCVQCVSERLPECIDKPPPPVACDERAVHCVMVKESLERNASVVEVTRTCSPVDLGSKCHDSFNLVGESVNVCYEACSIDGCNNKPHHVRSSKSSTSSSSSSAHSGTTVNMTPSTWRVLTGAVIFLLGITAGILY